jgi:hypothetical protein
MKDAVFENEATTSDFEVAPTLIADEMHPGELRAFVNPSFPAATAVAIPTERRLSMIGFIGSPSQNVVDEPPPRLRFTEEKLRELRRAYTRSSPAMMSDVQATAHGAEPLQSEAFVKREKT